MRSTASLKFILSDHLGSSTIVYDMSTGATPPMLYKPRGETRVSGSLPTPYGFTGQFGYTGDFSSSISDQDCSTLIIKLDENDIVHPIS